MGNKQMNKKSKQNKKKKGNFKKVLIIVAIILLLLGGLVAVKVYKNGGGMQGMLATMVGHNEETKKNLGEFRVLLMGVSTDISAELSDTIIVASYNPNTQKATLLSIPRDTYVGHNKKRANSYDKINALYQKGPEATLEAVNELTGLNIDKYIVIDTEALTELVDTIGGVDFNVPIDMKYDDTSQDLHIDLKQGMQHLNGEQAEGLVRFRHNNDGTSYPEEYGDNDLGRMRTQREFIMEVVRQTIQAKNIFKIGNILEIAHKNVETNVDLAQAKDYIPYVVDFDMANIKTDTIPGEPTKINGLWFFEADEEETELLVEELFGIQNGTTGTTETAENVISNTTENTIESTSQSSSITKSDRSKITVEILNGSGDSSNLSNVKEKLKKKGYKIYKTANTTATPKTVIISKSNEDDKYAQDIQQILKGGDISASSNTNSYNKVDYTIIIGKDY